MGSPSVLIQVQNNKNQWIAKCLYEYLKNQSFTNFKYNLFLWIMRLHEIMLMKIRVTKWVACKYETNNDVFRFFFFLVQYVGGKLFCFEKLYHSFEMNEMLNWIQCLQAVLESYYILCLVYLNSYCYFYKAHDREAREAQNKLFSFNITY